MFSVLLVLILLQRLRWLSLTCHRLCRGFFLPSVWEVSNISSLVFVIWPFSHFCSEALMYSRISLPFQNKYRRDSLFLMILKNIPCMKPCHVSKELHNWWFSIQFYLVYQFAHIVRGPTPLNGCSNLMNCVYQTKLGSLINAACPNKSLHVKKK